MRDAQQARDPLIAAAALVQAVQTVVSRSLDRSTLPSYRSPASSPEARLQRDSAEARIGGTVRAFRGEVQDRIEAALERLAGGIAAAHGVQSHLDYRRGYPPPSTPPPRPPLCGGGGTVAGASNVRRDLAPSMGAKTSRTCCARNRLLCLDRQRMAEAAACCTTALRLQRRHPAAGVRYWWNW